MEIKGEEFLNKVKYTQERNELEEKLFDLESKVNESKSNQTPQSANPYEQNNPYASNSNVSYEEEVTQSESELDDILLGANKPAQNSDNKKKYIILGLILAVLFLITIVIFKLLDNETAVTQNQAETIAQDKPLNDNIEQQYQKIVNDKLKKIQEQNEKTEIQQKNIDEAMNLKNIQKEEKAIPLPMPSDEDIQKAKELKKDIFDIQKEKPKQAVKVEVKKPEPVKVVKKPEIKKPVERKVTQTTPLVSNTKPSGTFIQVGAFSRTIDPKYMQNLNSSGLNYKLYKVNVKGKDFTKVLIGPYNSRNEATNAVNSVKNKLNVKSTFILKF